MNSQRYLESYGWTPGQPLQKGGIKKPILVSHKFDLKGVGHASKESVSWWETLFDGHLKSLDVNSKDGFGNDAEKLQKLEREEKKKTSPLYQMFVKGEVLMGSADRKIASSCTTGKKNGKCVSVEDTKPGQDEDNNQLMFFFSSDDEDGDESERKRRKRVKKEKKNAKKERKAARKESKVSKKERKAAKNDKKAAKRAAKKAAAKLTA